MLLAVLQRVARVCPDACGFACVGLLRVLGCARFLVCVAGVKLTGSPSRWCRFIPPLIVTEAEIETALAMFSRALQTTATRMQVRL